jgi:hypothetical protein
MSGKGDRQRPVDKETYDKNYELIDWGTKHEKSEQELLLVSYLKRTIALSKVEEYCKAHLFRCPASASQASMKSMALTILEMIEGKR